MHAEAHAIMAAELADIPEPRLGKWVLDVGSLDINGSYKPLVKALGMEYTGLDIMPGRNVDIVVQPYKFPMEDGKYDVVISGSTLEHCAHPWELLPEMARVLKPGGLLVIITHWNYPIHRHPVDCWRFLPDGIATLFDLTGTLTDYQIQIGSPYDIVSVATKKVEA